MLQHEGGRGADVAEVVGVVSIALHSHVVAEPLGLLVGVGVTPHPCEQAGVIDDGALRLVEAHLLAQTQRDEAGADHVLHGLTQP